MPEHSVEEDRRRTHELITQQRLLIATFPDARVRDAYEEFLREYEGFFQFRQSLGTHPIITEKIEGLTPWDCLSEILCSIAWTNAEFRAKTFDTSPEEIEGHVEHIQTFVLDTRDYTAELRRRWSLLE